MLTEPSPKKKKAVAKHTPHGKGMKAQEKLQRKLEERQKKWQQKMHAKKTTPSSSADEDQGSLERMLDMLDTQC